MQFYAIWQKLYESFNLLWSYVLIFSTVNFYQKGVEGDVWTWEPSPSELFYYPNIQMSESPQTFPGCSASAASIVEQLGALCNVSGPHHNNWWNFPPEMAPGAAAASSSCTCTLSSAQLPAAALVTGHNWSTLLTSHCSTQPGIYLSSSSGLHCADIDRGAKGGKQRQRKSVTMIEDVCTHGVGVAAAGGEVERRGVVPVQQVDVHPLVLRQYI